MGSFCDQKSCYTYWDFVNSLFFQTRPGAVLQTAADCCLQRPFQGNNSYYYYYYYYYYLLTYPMEQSPSWDANRYSASQGIPCILWNAKVHYRIHKCQPPVLIWARSIQCMPRHPTSWRSILISSSHLRQSLPGGLFPSSLHTKTLYTPLFSPHTC